MVFYGVLWCFKHRPIKQQQLWKLCPFINGTNEFDVNANYEDKLFFTAFSPKSEKYFNINDLSIG